jgi:hypothetical protein
MRVLLGAVVLGTCVGMAGCAGSGRTAARERDAIHAAASGVPRSWRSWFLSFPATPGTKNCVIHGGGPAPGVFLDGTCGTRVTFDDAGSALVRFIQTWSGSRYVWQIRVSRSGHVVRRSEHGDPPPQYWA